MLLSFFNTIYSKQKRPTASVTRSEDSDFLSLIQSNNILIVTKVILLEIPQS